MQAKDIPDRRFLVVVLNEQIKRAATWGETSIFAPEPWLHDKLPWTHFININPWFPEFPEKVIRAKAAKLIKRGLMTGCTCGCRGDLEVTDSGIQLLTANGFLVVGSITA